VKSGPDVVVTYAPKGRGGSRREGADTRREAVRVVVRVVLVDASRVPDAERVDPVAATVDRPRRGC